MASVIAALSALVLNCADPRELNRATAAALIRDSKDFRLRVSVTLPGKREWPTEARSMDEPEEDARLRAVDSYSRTNPEVAAFRHLGLIDFRASLVEGPTPAHAWWRFKLEPVLTEKGEQAAAGGAAGARQTEIVVARRELVEVTGITTQKAGTAQVEFTWKQMPTFAGEAFDPGSETYQGLPEWLRQKISGPPEASARAPSEGTATSVKGRRSFNSTTTAGGYSTFSSDGARRY